MTFAESIRTCLQKYVDFNGVASRPEFWWWTLFTVVTAMLLGTISSTLNIVFNLAALLPSIAVMARRLHDTDRSGWWQLLMLIPIIGAIVVLVFCAQKGKRPIRFA
jgi:uncharacterized membrane protein YhaH (DUF805 family)